MHLHQDHVGGMRQGAGADPKENVSQQEEHAAEQFVLEACQQRQSYLAVSRFRCAGNRFEFQSLA